MCQSSSSHGPSASSSLRSSASASRDFRTQKRTAASYADHRAPSSAVIYALESQRAVVGRM